MLKIFKIIKISVFLLGIVSLKTHLYAIEASSASDILTKQKKSFEEEITTAADHGDSVEFRKILSQDSLNFEDKKSVLLKTILVNGLNNNAQLLNKSLFILQESYEDEYLGKDDLKKIILECPPSSRNLIRNLFIKNPFELPKNLLHEVTQENPDIDTLLLILLNSCAKIIETRQS